MAIHADIRAYNSDNDNDDNETKEKHRNEKKKKGIRTKRPQTEIITIDYTEM